MDAHVRKRIVDELADAFGDARDVTPAMASDSTFCCPVSSSLAVEAEFLKSTRKVRELAKPATGVLDRYGCREPRGPAPA